MGVKDLWGILSPVQRHARLDELRGKTLAVDLSIWVVEVQGMKQLQGLLNPHLRNLFFRVHKLLQLGILPVFVLEGDPPPLKYEAMMKRAYGLAYKSGTAPPKKMGRSHFKSKLRECAEMLRYMGVPCVQSVGEAEAFCALLNKHGLVDACITEDGDAFLFGARTVYRNFTINDKDPSVEIYEMNDIELTLGLTQENLVAMALLLGCDFLPKGVPGVGREMCLKLLNSLPSVNILERMKQWRSLSQADIMNTKLRAKEVVHCNNCSHPGTTTDHSKSGCALCGTRKNCSFNSTQDPCPCHWHVAKTGVMNRSTELSVYKKAVADPAFPHPKVIKEFLSPKDKLPPGGWSWNQPLMFQMQKYATGKLEWEEKYTQEKMLSLLTVWTQRQILQKGQYSAGSLKPHRIVKCRVQKRVPVYEVEWHKCEGDDTAETEFYTTIEEQEMFNDCFPDIKQEFMVRCEQEANLKGKSRKKKPTKGNKESSNKENEIPAKCVENFAEDLTDFVPMSQLHLKDTLAELGIDPKAGRGNLQVGGDFLRSRQISNFVVEEISHALTQKAKISGKSESRSVPSSTVIDVSSSDEDAEFVPVSQQVAKSGFHQKGFEDAREYMKKCGGPRYETQKSDTSAGSDSEEENLDFLPLSQRVLLNMKKGSAKPKMQPADSMKATKIHSHKDISVLDSVSVNEENVKSNPISPNPPCFGVGDGPIKKVTNPKSAVTSDGLPNLAEQHSGLTGQSNATKLCSETSIRKNQIVYGKVTDVSQKPLASDARKAAQVETKTVSNKPSDEAADLNESVRRNLPRMAVANGPVRGKKVSKKKKLATNKKKKSVNFDALHGDLEMLCMDSVLGDITTGSFDGAARVQEMADFKKRSENAVPSVANRTAKNAKPYEENPCKEKAKTRSSRLHELTFGDLDDLEDEIISGAAEIFDEELENITQSSSNAPAEVQSLAVVENRTENAGKGFSLPKQINHDFTVWDQDQKGHFDLGLTFDSTVTSAMADSTVIADSCNGTHTDSTALVLKNSQHTLYADSCLTQTSVTSTCEEMAISDKTMMYAASYLGSEGSTLFPSDTRTYFETASKTVLQSETASLCEEPTVNYVRNQSSVVDGSRYYIEDTCHEVAPEDFTTPEICTINTPNVTCIEVPQDDCSVVSSVISSSVFPSSTQAISEKEVTSISAKLVDLNLDDKTLSNSTFDSFVTVVEAVCDDTRMSMAPEESSELNNNDNDAELYKTALSNEMQSSKCFVDDTVVPLHTDRNEDTCVIDCDNSVIELEETVQNDSDLIPPSPLVLSQRLGARLQGSQLRTLSMFSQSSQSSRNLSSQPSRKENAFGVSADDSDVVFLD